MAMTWWHLKKLERNRTELNMADINNILPYQNTLPTGYYQPQILPIPRTRIRPPLSRTYREMGIG